MRSGFGLRLQRAACTVPWGQRWWASLAVVWLSVGCGQSSLSRTALQGDLPQLQREISSAQKQGTLDRAQTRDLALAVARRELRTATGDAAVERVREVRACLPALEDELQTLAEKQDDGGAAAALALLEAGRSDAEDLFAAYINASSPSWRAVGARAAIGATHSAARQKRVVDADLRVRRAALHAAAAQPVAADLPVLLEAARLDPDALARSVAVRAVGALGSPVAVNALRDLWATADVETRQGLVDAWATPASLKNGGKLQLLWVMETQRGLPSVVAASRLAQTQGPEREQALAALERSISQGAVEEQRLAVLLAPTAHPSILAAVDKLSLSSDAQAAVLAAAALGRHPEQRDKARTKLRVFAKSEQVWIARQARVALVVLGDVQLAPTLKAELASKLPEQRRQAAVDLLRLGRFSDAAPALADASASVRTQVACETLGLR